MFDDTGGQEFHQLGRVIGDLFLALLWGKLSIKYFWMKWDEGMFNASFGIAVMVRLGARIRTSQVRNL